MDISRRFDKYICGMIGSCPTYDYKDKSFAVQNLVSYMLARTQRMFEYNGLPDTIPARSLELYLQVNGNVCIAKRNGNLYAFTGGLGGEPNPYYMPTIYTVANPALRFSENYRIDENCVVIPSDSMYLGLLPMFSRYATEIVEAEITLMMATKNSRSAFVFAAPDDRTKASAERYLEQVQEGKDAVISENAFLDGVRLLPGAASGSYRAISDVIEALQYLKASWLNDLGLDANFNMKREILTSAENAMNEDSLYPLVDDMLENRKIGVEKVNSMFGTNITVDLSSSWKRNAEQVEMEIDFSNRSENNGNGGEEVGKPENT